LRIRSGTGVTGHDGCPGVNDRFHLVSCDRYLAKRPRFLTLFNDKRVPEWRDWWQSHFNLGLGILSEHEDNDGVVKVCGNPFQRTVTQLINGTLSLFHLGAPDSRCTRCLLKNCSGGNHCHLPVKCVTPGSGGRRVALTWWPDVGPGGECGSSAKIFRAHLHRFPGCALHYFVPFWYNVVHNWDELAVIDGNTAVLQWGTDKPGLCVCRWSSPNGVGRHLKLRAGHRCLECIVAMFEVWTSGGGGRPALHMGLEVVWRRG